MANFPFKGLGSGLLALILFKHHGSLFGQKDTLKAEAKNKNC